MSEIKVTVFAGSSISHEEIRKTFPEFNVAPPIRRGDLEKHDADIFCIIDGYFHQNLSVAPQEISRSLANGSIVIGASSIGALRASECHTLGMVGIGEIYTLFRNGQLTRDDEVAVAIDPETQTQISDALADIRVFIKNKFSDENWPSAILTQLETTHFEERSFEVAMRKASSDNLLSQEQALEVINLFKIQSTQKHIDALQALETCQRVVDLITDDLAETGSRAVDNKTAWSIVEPLLQKFGITRIADISGLDKTNIPVYQAYRPKSKYPVTVFSGKGRSHEQSRMSAAMESIESYLAESYSPKLLKGQCADPQLSHIKKMDLSTLGLPGAINLDTHVFDWLELKSFEGDSIWAPKELVLMPCPNRHWNVNTNGIASGLSREDALLHGVLEVIERDAVSIALVCEKATPVHPIYLKNRSIECLLAQFAAAHLSVYLKDVTSSIGVPTFYCVITESEKSKTRYFASGSGCHPNPVIAIVRALTEAAQSHNCLIAGAREDLDQKTKRIEALNSSEILAQFKYWYSDFETASRPESRLYDYRPNSPQVTLAEIVASLRDQGFQVYYTDFSNKETPIYAFRIVVPGLESFVVDKLRIGPRLIEHQPLLKQLLTKQKE